MRFNQAIAGHLARTPWGEIGGDGPAGDDLERDAGGLAEAEGAEVVAADDRRHAGAETDHPLAPDALVSALARPGDVVDDAGAGDRSNARSVLVEVVGAPRRPLDPKARGSVGREVEAAGEQVGAGEAVAAANVDAIEAAQGEPLGHLVRLGEEGLVARGVDPQLVLEALRIREPHDRQRVAARRAEAQHRGAGGAEPTFP